MITDACILIFILEEQRETGCNRSRIDAIVALQLSDVADPNLSNSYLESVSRAVEEAARVWGGGRRLSRTLKGRKCLERWRGAGEGRIEGVTYEAGGARLRGWREGETALFTLYL